GSSRADSLAQPLARLVAALALAGWIAARRPWKGAALRPAFVMLGLLALLLSAQLVPMPAEWWSALPGRAPFLASATAAGLPQPWRPINLVPDRGWNSLFVLLVPLATLVGLAQFSSRRRTKLLAVVWVLAMISAVLGLAQISGGANSALRPYAYSSNAFAAGFFANRNHQALLLAAALPILAAWATLPDLSRDIKKSRAMIATGIAAFILLMVPTTGSRAGLVLTAIGSVAAVAIAWADARAALARVSSRRRKRWLAYGAGGVAALVGTLFFYGRNDSIQRLYGMSLSDDLRARTLPTVLQMTREFFPVGSGFGNFDIVYRRFEPFSALSSEYLNQAHNDVIQFVLEGGIFGAALLTGVTGWAGSASIKAWRAPPSPERQAARAGSAVLLMALIASIFDYPLRTPLMMVVVAIAWAWLLTPTRDWSSSEAPEPEASS
ncbi:MAG TPA: O-antigen ligase family protein, partial [Sphingomicrobium sp.]